MKRKVIKQGNNTLTITLPREWTNRLDLQPGDEVELDDLGFQLSVSSDKKEDLLRIEMDITDLDFSSILHEIRSAYRMGYDDILLTYSNNEAISFQDGKKYKIRNIIQNEVKQLVGVEVINQKDDFSHIKDISATSEKEFDNILRRIFLILVDIGDDLVKGAKDFNKDLLDHIYEKHVTITKFISFCLRLLNKKGYPDFRKTRVLYHIIASMDKVTDYYKFCAKDLIDYGKKINPKTLGLLKSINHAIYLFYEIFYKYDKEKVVEISKIKWSMRNQIKKLKGIPTDELMILTHVENCLEILLDLMEAVMVLRYHEKIFKHV